MMQIISLDIESYYDQQFSLSKITTEEYVRSPLFQTIGVGVKVNEEETIWYSGDDAGVTSFLGNFDWGNSALLAHNALFDAAILNGRSSSPSPGVTPWSCSAPRDTARA